MPDSGNSRTVRQIGTRVANTGASFATGVAYLLFALMFLTMIAEIFLVIMRAYS